MELETAPDDTEQPRDLSRSVRLTVSASHHSCDQFFDHQFLDSEGLVFVQLDGDGGGAEPAPLKVAGIVLAVTRATREGRTGWCLRHTTSRDDGEQQLAVEQVALLQEYERHTEDCAALRGDQVALLERLTGQESDEQSALLAEVSRLSAVRATHQKRLAALTGGEVLLRPSVCTTATTHEGWLSDGYGHVDLSPLLHACGRLEVVACLGKTSIIEVSPASGRRWQRQSEEAALFVVQTSVVVGEPVVRVGEPWRLAEAHIRRLLALETERPAAVYAALRAVVSPSARVTAALLRLELTMGKFKRAQTLMPTSTPTLSDDLDGELSAVMARVAFENRLCAKAAECLQLALDRGHRPTDETSELVVSFGGSQLLWEFARRGSAQAQYELYRYTRHTQLSRHWLLLSVAQSYAPALCTYSAEPDLTAAERLSVLHRLAEANARCGTV
jgi:hypothetical protein